MQETLDAVIEEVIEQGQEGYYIGNLSSGCKRDLDRLRDYFVRHAKEYFEKKGKITEDGKYQAVHKEKRSFTLDEHITPLALTEIIPLSRKTIQSYVQNHCSPNAFTGRDLLLLSELSDVKMIQSIPNYISFENACALLQIESNEEKINFTQIAFQKKIDSTKTLSEDTLWDVKREFLFEMLSYFYEELPNKFSGNKIKREKGKENDVEERIYKNDRDKIDVEKSTL